MFKKMKGLRTYSTLAVIAAVGVIVDLQASCKTNPAELAELCQHIMNPYVGKAIVGLSALAAWFRKLASTEK